MEKVTKITHDQIKSAALRANRLIRPKTRAELRQWVRLYANMRLPAHGTCPGHCTPLDYLDHVFFERGNPADTVVWACRGGGKTMIGAVATLLDLLFKPGIQIRILGGSRDQSERMYTYLCTLITDGFDDLLQGKIARKGFTLANGSKVEILTQSQTSVRGTRVQKMRCDELDLFKEKVWDAAQLTTRSMWLDDPDRQPPAPPGVAPKHDKDNTPDFTRPLVHGAVEVFSTMHRPSGLMSKLVARAAAPLGQLPATLDQTPIPATRKIFAWCIWDVVGICREAERKCEGCVLLPDCQSRARHGTGFVPIVDVLAFHERSARATWEAEMLCHVPYPEHQVFAAFRKLVHVRAFPADRVEPGQSVMEAGRTFRIENVIAGIDYGWQKFVCLWLAMGRDAAGRRVVWALDEYVMPQRALEGHAAAILARGWKGGEIWKPSVFYGDVAGRQHDAHTGQTSEAILRGCGITIKSRAMKIDEGIAALSRLIEPHETWGQATPTPRFFVDPRCANLIDALANYEKKDDKPVKDGEHDHLIDALRYAVAGHDGTSGNVTARRY